MAEQASVIPKITQNEAGFSAVELLITLIVASMFLFSGYQLYAQVTKDGSEANKTATLSNRVYVKLREKGAQINSSSPSGCTAASEAAIANYIENVPGVGSVTFSTEVKCQNTAASLDVFKIRVRGSYIDGGVTKAVEHATYVN